MASETYFYPYPTAGFTWNAYHQKVKQAIGRVPIGTARVSGNQIAITFDPPLDAGEETLVAAIFADPATAAKVPTEEEYFCIKDAFDSSFMEDLNTAVTAVHGDPITFWIYFCRTDALTPDGRTDTIVLAHDRPMTVQEKKERDSVISSLLLGDMTVVEI